MNQNNTNNKCFEMEVGH